MADEPQPEQPQPEQPEVTTTAVTRETVTQTGPAVATFRSKAVEHMMDLILLAGVVFSTICTIFVLWLFPANKEAFTWIVRLGEGFGVAFFTRLTVSKRP